MLESLLFLALCLLIGLAALAVIIYLAVTGLLFTLGGMLLALICVTTGGMFVANIAWSAYNGELKQILGQLRKNRN